MIKRIGLSLLAILCGAIVIFIPYYVGLSAMNVPDDNPGEVIVWFIGLFILCGVVGCILLFVGWIKWLLTGKVFDNNGLTKTSNTIKLGGTLTSDGDIDNDRE